MGAGIITGWLILFAVFFVSKKNHIFELNTTFQENAAEHENREIEREENEDGSIVVSKSN